MKKKHEVSVLYETKRLQLRMLCMEDIIGPYANWFNDQEVCSCNSHGIFPMPPDALKEYVRSLPRAKDKIVWAIVDKKSRRHIGNVSLQNIDLLHRSAEFAIILGEKEYWGKGYGYEAAEVLIQHGFNKLNLNRIYCGTTSRNLGMQHLSRKLKMKNEGRRREAFLKEGCYQDVYEYGVLRREFIK